MTIKELEKRIDHLETEVELLKELVKLQNARLNDSPVHITPINPFYDKSGPTLEPLKITCEETLE